jgi:D-alanyl-D-alanine carboxypeptidase
MPTDFARICILLYASGLACASAPSGGGGPGPEQQANVQPAASHADSQLVAAIERFARERAAADSFSGVVLLARHGVPLLRLHFGIADRATGLRNDSETLFNLASVDKHFTRLAISALVRAGKLSLADTVGRHLPSYPNPRVRSEVTVQHLLGMRSGIPDFAEDYDYYLKQRLTLRTLDDFLLLFAREPLRFDPGSKAEYSNGGYVVLGKIIEAVTGTTYYDHVRRHVFDPAGMRRTGFHTVHDTLPNLAVGYTTDSRVTSLRQADGRAPNTTLLPFRGSSSGGGYATANDLLALSRALSRERQGRLDSLLSVRPVANLNLEVEGWTGGSEGVNTVFYMHSTGHTLIVLSNVDPPSATVFRRRMWDDWLPRWMEHQRP